MWHAPPQRIASSAACQTNLQQRHNSWPTSRCIHAGVRPVALRAAGSAANHAPAAAIHPCSSYSIEDGWLHRASIHMHQQQQDSCCRRACLQQHGTSSSSRKRSSICRSAPSSSRLSITNQQAAQDIAHLADAQDQLQQLSGLYQLVRQQQASIATLQQEVQQLRGVMAAGAGASGAAQLQQPYVGSYKTMTIEDFKSLPDKIIMVRHAESQGNVDARTYSNTPDYEVPLSARGWEQAVACGHEMRLLMEAEHGRNYKLFFMTSPYCRTRQTFVGVRQAFPDENFAGVQEEVQLREQDFGNFQNPDKIKSDLAERNRFGRFYYRFPDGESGSDVYNRVSIFEDHLIRDMKAGKFSHNTSLCLVTHGLTMRVFLMRWFNWTVESFLQVYNPPNAKPIVVDKISEEEFVRRTSKLRDRRQTLQVKNAYKLRKDSMARLKIQPQDNMCDMDAGVVVHQEY